MIDNLLGDDDDDETADESDDEEMGGLFDDPGDGTMDGAAADGGDDDLMGGGDEMTFDDGDGGGGGASNSEMNNRIEELENEVDSLSSAVNTVKSENEQISEALDDVEENIRKLLEVYEMVTRGVNPFVDEEELGDAFGGGGGGGGGGSMGLFGGEEDQDTGSDIDDSVANAEAEEFFDDDFDESDDPDGDEEFEDDVDALDEEDDVDGLDEGDDVHGSDDGEGGESSGSGKSFEEIKTEYESGEAEWEGDGADDGAPEDGDHLDDLETDGADGADEASGDVQTDGSDTPSAEPDADGDGKPYLRELPDGYVSDVVVMDWLEFLVDEGGIDGAARTIAYYEAIDWVSESAAESLQTYLRGFGDGFQDDPEPRSWLTVSHHNTSLRFISRIDDPSMEMVAFDERGQWPRQGAVSGSDPPGGLQGANGCGPDRSFGSNSPQEPELESDGGRRTPVEGGAATYDPTDAGRGKDGYSDENDSGGTSREVGYGGFYWNNVEQ